MILSLLLACASNAAPPSIPEAGDPTPPAAPAEAGLQPGTYSGPACGERKWERLLFIEAGGAYKGSELISPCPEGAQCMWSGVEPFSGLWKLEGDKVILAETPAGQGKRPDHLTIKDGALFEDSGCRYDRKPSP